MNNEYNILDIFSFCWSSAVKILKKDPTFPAIIIMAIVAYISFLTQKRLAKSKNSIDFQSAYHDSREIQMALLSVMSLVKKSSTLELTSLANTIGKSISDAEKIRIILNEWEKVAIAIKKDIYDEDILYLAYGSTIIYLWKMLRPFIIERQQKNPRLYINFDWLALKWMIKRDALETKSQLKKLVIIQKNLHSLNFK